MSELIWLFPLCMAFAFGYCIGEWREESRRNDEWWAERGEPPTRVWPPVGDQGEQR